MERRRREVVRTAAYTIHVIGVPALGLRDLYHALLRVPWWAAFAVIVGSYLGLNGIFAASDFPIPRPGQPGTLGRNTFRGPRYFNVDLSLIKTVRVLTGLRLAVRRACTSACSAARPPHSPPRASCGRPASRRARPRRSSVRPRTR